MNNTQVAHLWASRNRESAKGSNFYFQGDTIYSYGPHFPIARWDGNVVLFTTKGYSNSTSHHISHTRRAIPSGVTVFKVHDVTCENPSIRVEEYMQNIRDAFEFAKRARTATWKHENTVRLVAEFKSYCEHYRIPYPFEGSEMDEIVEKAKEKIAEFDARREEITCTCKPF